MVRSQVITQGEFSVSADPQATISTLLGSCVACCVWDPLAAVGGMNHILLASTSRNDVKCDRLGVNAMELLINELLKLGARRERLLAKAFGGAQMINGLSDIGPANCAFATEYLARENIKCIAKSLGGTAARQVVFTPFTGAVRVKVRGIAAPEPIQTAPRTKGNDLELF